MLGRGLDRNRIADVGRRRAYRSGIVEWLLAVVAVWICRNRVFIYAAETGAVRIPRNGGERICEGFRGGPALVERVY